MRNVLNTKTLYDWLEKIDKELAQEVGAAGCEYCGGVLHRGDYDRKPRGGPEEVMERWDKRARFCCAREGCPQRHPAPSVRFLGR